MCHEYESAVYFWDIVISSRKSLIGVPPSLGRTTRVRVVPSARLISRVKVRVRVRVRCRGNLFGLYDLS